jgi:hypothetical protein
MRRGLGIALAAALLAPAAAAAQPVSYTALDPAAYHAFVVNWTPDTAPLCALISSAAQWSQVMHPAPVMGGPQTFGPPDTIWRTQSVLLLARVTPAGATASTLHPVFVKLTGGVLEVDYQFKAPPAASSTIKDYMALQIPEVVPTSVVFKENGETVCSLARGKGVWLSPASAGR